MLSESEKITREDIRCKPWKYIGYPGFASFLSSDPDFFLLRRFGTLHARVLLALQDEIVLLEERLNTLDSEARAKEQQDRHNGTFRGPHVEARNELIAIIHGNLKEYNALFLQHAEMQSRPSASALDITSVKNWLDNRAETIRPAEREYLGHTRDLVNLVPQPTSRLRKSLTILASSLRARFSMLRVQQDNDDHDLDLEALASYGDTHYASDSRLDGFIAGTITTIGLGMLIAPLWILEFVKSPIRKLAVITGFVVLFLGLLTFSTVAKPLEGLAATAAYMAVLVVFLQAGP